MFIKMKKDVCYLLAFDIGATSGRSILGMLYNGKIELKELTRFPNKMIHIGNKFYWDIFALYGHLKNALSVAASQKIPLDAVGIDTWGVDFVYLGADGTLLSQPRSYRDPYTNGKPEEYFKLVPKKEVYNLTGIQIMNFNSIYQLFAAQHENFSPLKSAEFLLFMPDALSYLLTGKKVCEYTIASTSQLLNPKTKRFETKLFEAMGLNSSIMQSLVIPGTVIGNLTESVAKECGLAEIPVIAVAGHDTGSAVAAVPAENEKFAYLSSGTWSLMGIEVKDPIITEESYKQNFTNEGGVEGTTRFLKNITGMWLLEQCRKEWDSAGRKYSYSEIVKLSESVKGFQSVIDPDHCSFANPDSMTKAIVQYCRANNQKVPETDAAFIRCIFDSLALKYKCVFNMLQTLSPFSIEKLNVIGGGSQNKSLNQMIADAIGIPVVAGPSEATAIGNLMMQAKGLGAVGSLAETRSIIRRSFSPENFYPRKNEAWGQICARFYPLK